MIAAEEGLEIRELVEALAYSHDELSHIVHNVNSIIMKFDTQGRITFINRFAVSFFDYQPDELINQPLVGTIVPPTETGGRDLATFIHNMCTHPENYPTAMTEGRKKSGELVWIAWTNRPTYYLDGTLKEIISVGNDVTAIRNKEQVKAYSEVLHRNIIELSPNAIFVETNEGRILDCNTAACKMFGYSKGEMLTLRIHDLVPRDFAKTLPPVITEDMTTDDEFVERANKKRDGSFILTEINTKMITIDGEQRLLAYIRDITARKKAEEELRKLTVAVEQSPSSVVITDMIGRIEYVNPKFVALTGYSAEEAIGANPRILKSGHQSPEVYEDMWQTLLTGREWRGEFCNKKKNGDIYWEFASISPIRNDKGVITHYLAVKEDISERKKAEEALGFAYAQLEEIFNTAPDAMTLIDRDYTIQILNKTMADMLGIDKNGAIGKKCHELLGNEMCNTADCPLHRIMDGEERVEADVNIEGANGRRIPCLFTAIPYRPAGELVGVVETFKDMTERKRAEEEMRKDFQLGAKIQRQFIPAPICNDKIVLKSIYEPYAYVSGDLLDYVWVGDRLFGYVIDVMGHGLATALQTSALRVLFRQAAEKQVPLVERLFEINQASMSCFAEDSFAACICFEVDFNAMTMSYVSGGINFFLASSGALQGVVTVPGSFLGITETPSFEQHTIPIAHGDTFYFVSDGIFDIMDDTVIAGVRDYSGTVEALRAKARSKKRWDDTTAMCIKIKAKSPWPVVYEFYDAQEFCRSRTDIREQLQKLTDRPTSLLEVALNEAVNNAIRAAGRQDDCFKVTLKMNTVGRRVIIRVKDSGPGFAGNGAIASLDGCSADLFEKAIFQESGRGLMIMKACFDDVIYNCQGNEVLLAKKL